MKYRVRNKDGELEYESFKQVEEAAQLGVVDPDDELLREGETEWKKVSAVPGLLKGKRSRASVFRTQLTLLVGVAVGAAIFAFWAIRQGHADDRPELYGAGISAAFVSPIRVPITTGPRSFRKRCTAGLRRTWPR